MGDAFDAEQQLVANLRPTGRDPPAGRLEDLEKRKPANREDDQRDDLIKARGSCQVREQVAA
jgi:hypothetical protein